MKDTPAGPPPPLGLNDQVSPAGDGHGPELADILDVSAFQSLLEQFYYFARIPMAIIDIHGTVLVGVGWQQICTRFHRVHPETCKHCIESDTHLTAGVAPGEFRLYKCKNNMWDVATPIMVGDRHVGNLFTGQFFFDGEPLDYELFRAQARKYGFNEDAYLAALEAVPRLSREALDRGMAFFVKIAHMISQLSFSNIQLKRREAEQERLNRTLKAHSRSNQALLRARHETEFMEEVCRIVVEDCGHAMAWIGFAEHDAAKTVRPAASAGFEAGYLETLKITWADDEYGRGPTGTAIRTGKPCMCRDMQTDPRFLPWRAEAVKRGYSSSLVLPLMEDGKGFGSLSIYSREADPFTQDEVALLTQLASDLAYGITSMRLRAAHQHAEQALRQSEERYRSLVERSPEAIFVNRNDRIAFMNPAALALFGATRPEQVLGKSPFDFFHPDYHAGIRERIQRLRSGQPVPVIEKKIVRLDGTERDVEVSAVLLSDSEGPAIQVILHDITERKLAEEALRRTAGELARSNQDLEQFAYVASHDLQEPLRMVTGFVELLREEHEGKLAPQAETYIKFAVDGARRMQILIDDLLTYSRVSTRGGDFEPTDAGEALEMALAALQTAIVESGAIIQHDPLPTLKADVRQLAQLFQNLIGNAIKFRGPESPRIQVGARLEGDDWLFLVQDNGIGIDPEFKERIFLIFQRLHTRQKYPGTGIGLAICKKIVERHGGQIWLDPTSTPGARFCFTIPS